jgi:hypothetical protein
MTEKISQKAINQTCQAIFDYNNPDTLGYLVVVGEGKEQHLEVKKLNCWERLLACLGIGQAALSKVAQFFKDKNISFCDLKKHKNQYLSIENLQPLKEKISRYLGGIQSKCLFWNKQLALKNVSALKDDLERTILSEQYLAEVKKIKESLKEPDQFLYAQIADSHGQIGKYKLEVQNNKLMGSLLTPDAKLTDLEEEAFAAGKTQINVICFLDKLPLSEDFIKLLKVNGFVLEDGALLLKESRKPVVFKSLACRTLILTGGMIQYIYTYELPGENNLLIDLAFFKKNQQEPVKPVYCVIKNKAERVLAPKLKLSKL